MKQNKQQTKILINWPDAYFLSLADKEKFIETSIVTLRSHYYDMITQHAYEKLSQVEDITDPDFYKKVDAMAETMIKESFCPVKEYVKTDKERAMVCLNVQNVDYTAIEMALERLASLGDIKPGIYKEFGVPTTFSMDEILNNFKKH